MSITAALLLSVSSNNVFTGTSVDRTKQNCQNVVGTDRYSGDRFLFFLIVFDRYIGEMIVFDGSFRMLLFF